MPHVFESMDAFWEYVKAQGCQTARVWGRLSDQERDWVFRTLPGLHANLEALRAGVEAEVRP
jgi:hypothetical protein